ncbi:TIGR02452 family protein [Aquimarina sp. 2201CG14-23]|uniref:TIGR02452 family protein n=1 Tax=Aquimarina mycalae TaxID=3040073 RepID=UPI002477F0B9|nr:TIGR02452 family protein [Aquimarina sp. 2201CG14-23]MDH7444321.1 TIGR02452 family protein [Aquimarina sp. 2201CG14-23]
MQKTLRKITAKETLKIINKGLYINQKSEKIYIRKIQEEAVNGTIYHSSDELDDILYARPLKSIHNTVFEVVEETTINSIQRLISAGFLNPMCLNFASAKNPGGGFFNGAQAQEESIARSSGLYPCQLSAIEFYETHRAMKSCIYTDGMIYSPKVPILRNDKGELFDTPIVSSIITAAAVNKGVVKRFEADKVSKIEDIMRVRIDKLLALSIANDHKTLILGAWGCGVFQNDPNMIARLFSELLKGKYRGVFEKVVFAIYAKSKKYIEAFQNEFEK